MILHWLGTGWRSLISNPLFSLITIISLSVGCCGALLVGANLKQHLSFESQVPAADRVFMLTRQIDQAAMGPGMRLEGNGIRRPQPSVQAPMRAAIEKELPDVELAARMFRGQSLLPPDPSLPTGPPQQGEPPRPPPPGSIYVDPEFFEMFDIKFVEGSVEGLSQPNQIVITEAAAQRLFGEASPMNQMTEGADKRQFRVVGVVKDLPLTTHLRFEAISSVKTLEQIVAAEAATQNSGGGEFAGPPRTFDSWTSGNSGSLYLRIREGANKDTFAGMARQVVETVGDRGTGAGESFAGPGGQVIRINAMNYNYNVVPLLDVHLGGPDLTGLPSSGDIRMLATLAAAAIALLIVSAFNYVTLSLARSLRRRREVAVRKVLGADQGALVRHYLAESAIVTAIALVLGFALAQLLHPWFARAIGQPETLFDLFDPAFLTTSLVFFTLLAIAVGAYPAFYLAQTRPRTALGEGGTASPGRMSQWVTGGLMGLQISAATGLLIVAMTMGAQARYIETRPLGFETKDRFQVQAPCPITQQMPQEELNNLVRRCQTGVKQILARVDGVSSAAFVNGAILTDSTTLQPFGRSAKGEKLGEAGRLSVDTDFLQTMGAQLLAGRFFDGQSAYDTAAITYQNEMQARMRTVAQSDGQGRTMMFATSQDISQMPKRPDRVPVIVTRAMLASLGVNTPDEAIGQQIYNQPNSQYAFEIVGVVEDWNQRPLKYAVYPMMFIPTPANNAVVEILPDQVDNVRAQITQAWRDYLGPGAVNPTVTLRPLSQTLEQSYLADFQLMRAVTSFAVVAIVVAGLGVFGLSAFEMRRRVREIGIRKALGASPWGVGGLVVGRALAFAAIAALVAWPIGFWIANAWLNDFVYRTSLSWLVLPVASVVVVGFVAVAVAFSATRAAAVRPGMALRV